MTAQPQEQQAPMDQAPGVTRVEWAPVPRVNLLPPEVLDARRFKSVQWRLALVVVLVAAIGAGAVVWSQSQVTVARQELAGTRARTGELQVQEARYADVPRTLAAVAAAKTARERALGRDVLWYRFLNDVALATPATVSLTTMTVALNAGGGAQPTTGADPLAPAGIGTVTVSGTATTYPAVSAWMESIVGVTGLKGVTLQSATRTASSTSEASPPVTFTAQLVVTQDALSHRYDRKAG